MEDQLKIQTVAKLRDRTNITDSQESHSCLPSVSQNKKSVYFGDRKPQADKDWDIPASNSHGEVDNDKEDVSFEQAALFWKEKQTLKWFISFVAYTLLHFLI